MSQVKWIILVGVILVVAAVGGLLILGGSGKNGNPRPLESTKGPGLIPKTQPASLASWCGYARQFGGTRLIQSVTTIGGPDLSTIANGYATTAPHGVRADARALADGIQRMMATKPPSAPDAATVAAAQRVDTFVATQCPAVTQ